MSETRKSEEIRRLLEEHLPTTYRFALHFIGDHHVAQDVAQEAMLRAWKNRKQLKDQKSGRAWLLRIAANLCRDRIRRNRHPASQTNSIEQTIPDQIGTPATEAIADEQRTQIQSAMAALPENYRAVLHLYSIEKLSLAEIAHITGERVGTVKVRLFRARKTLHAALTRLGILEET